MKILTFFLLLIFAPEANDKEIILLTYESCFVEYLKNNQFSFGENDTEQGKLNKGSQIIIAKIMMQRVTERVRNSSEYSNFNNREILDKIHLSVKKAIYNTEVEDSLLKKVSAELKEKGISI